MTSLTTRQTAVLDVIRRHIEAHGIPPSRKEICTAMGFKSPHSATVALRILVKKGAITVIPNCARGIRVMT
jgi:repressor LexA